METVITHIKLFADHLPFGHGILDINFALLYTDKDVELMETRFEYLIVALKIGRVNERVLGHGCYKYLGILELDEEVLTNTAWILLPLFFLSHVKLHRLAATQHSKLRAHNFIIITLAKGMQW